MQEKIERSLKTTYEPATNTLFLRVLVVWFEVLWMRWFS